MKISPSVASLTESQQLDDKIRSIIKQLNLPIADPSKQAVDDLAGEPDPRAMMRAMGGPGGPRGELMKPRSKNEWLEKIREFVAVDPTGENATYLQWIAKQVLKGGLVFPEDADKTRDTLDRFDKMRRSPKFQGDKNVLAYKSFADLYKTVEENSKNVRSVLIRDGAEVVAGPKMVRDVVFDYKTKKKIDKGELGYAQVVKITTYEAGDALFTGAWCVKNRHNFDCASYKPPYFMIALKKVGSDHFEPVFLHDRHSLSLMNDRDQKASLDDMRPYGELLQEAGILDAERGLKYILSGGRDIKENEPLAYLSVIMSPDKELKRRAVEALTDCAKKLRTRATPAKA